MAVGIRIPDSTIASQAFELAREMQSESLTNHCTRTYLFGALAAERDELKYDGEAFYIGAMLHDLGLVPPYDALPRPFEIEGADAARSFLEAHGYAAAKAALVREAIANHLSLDAAGMQPEVALVHIGAAADVVGMRLDRIAADELARVLVEYPRLGFKREVQTLLGAQVRQKPASTIAFMYEKLNFERLFMDAPFEE